MLPFKAQTVRAQRQELEDSRPLPTNSLLDLIKCFIQVDIAQINHISIYKNKQMGIIHIAGSLA